MTRNVRRDPIYQDRARELRSHMNDAERRLWSRLRAHRMDGRKFRRQHAIGSYIVDFVCFDEYNEDTGEWEEWGCGYVTTC